MKHLDERDLVLLYYGELKSRAAAEEHLAGCSACREAYAGLTATLGAIEPPEAPERGEDYPARVWQRLSPRLAAPVRRPFWSFVLAPPRWAAAGAIAALIVAAFFVGRFFPAHRGGTETARVAAPQVRERVLLVAVGDHLERSQMVLLELINNRPEGQVDMTEEQQRAHDLVASNRLYRQAAVRSGDRRIASVLDELERTLLEIANSPARLSSREFEELRQRVEAQGILFKVRIVDSQVRRKAAQPPAPAAAPTGVRGS